MKKFDDIKKLNACNEKELITLKGGGHLTPTNPNTPGPTGTFYTPMGTGTSENPDSCTDGDVG